jgi:hypothetical protein
MSGPKAADVQLKVNKAIKLIESQFREADATRKLYSNLGVQEAEACRNAAQRLALSSTWSEAAIAHAGEEIRAANECAQSITSAVRDADALMNAAEDLRTQAEDRHRASQDKLSKANRLCQEAMNAVNEAGIFRHMAGFNDEDQWAKDARQLAQASVDDDRAAKQFLCAATDKYRQARNAYDRALSGATRAVAEIQRVEELASKRVETVRIAAENRKQATQAIQEADSLQRQISVMQHDKFSPGEFKPAKAALERMEREFSAGNHDSVNRLGIDCLRTLRSLMTKVSNAQSAWEIAKRSAENDLDTVGKELAALDRGFLAKWSGNGEQMDSIFRRLEEARKSISREDFAEAQQLLATVLSDARSAFELATTNRHKFKEREIISEALMNALCEQGYDAPSFYFQDTNNQGEDNELSDLTIFAQAPGKLGDMRMKIDLGGKVKLELDKIPEGKESECVNILNGLRDRLEGEVNFQMTDWGRAEGNAGKAKEVTIEQVKVQEKQRERQGG